MSGHNHEDDDEEKIKCGCCHCDDCCDDDDEEGELSLRQLIAAFILFAAALLLEYLPVFKGNGALLSSNAAIAQSVLVIKLALFALAYIICGKNVVISAVKNILRGQVFDEKFLMAVTSIVAIVLGEYSEAVAVMLFYQLGEYFQDYAVDKSRDSIQSLMEVRPDKAIVLRGGREEVVAPESVAVGETILVKPGERIPLDGEIIEGKSFVDTSALTGESVPREVFEGAAVMGGFVNTQGVLKIKVTKLFGESSVSRILELVEHASARKARAEKFITRFAKVYTPLVCLAAVLVAIVPPVFVGADWSTWIYRALMFLVVSCPCALVISVPLSFFGGIGAASRKGILVKGSNYMESLAQVKTAAFDKTGTLTKGVFIVSDIHPSEKNKISRDELIAIATHAEKYSDHPISKSLKAAHHCPLCESADIQLAKEISGQGICVKVDGDEVLAGNLHLMESYKVRDYIPCQMPHSGTVVHIAVNGNYAGHIVISDQVKEESEAAIRELKKLGVKKTVLLTGDNKESAEITAAALGIDEIHAELLPEEKVGALEKLLGTAKKSEKLLFAGDGINDAPVLARADIGIAMGALGSDAAIEAADIVIMNDNPGQIADGIKIARRTMGVVHQNIVFSLGVKFAIMILAALGIGNIWLAVFGDVGVLFLAVLNAMRLSFEK